MSAEESKALLRRIAAEFNKRNLAIVDELFSPNFVLHDANHPDWPRGLEGARKMFTSMLAVAPDLQISMEDVVAEGNKVVVRWTFRGTITRQSITGAPPTGESVTVLAIGIYRIVNGKVEEDWGMGVRSQTAKSWQ